MVILSRPELTRRMLERGDHRNVQALERDVRAWIANWNINPKPFVWTKTAEQILQSIQRLMKRIKRRGTLETAAINEAAELR
ncbi:hypothetical protein [Candidatus Mycobacterium methanotrophicum]|uniref:hypothetical protein n=1 Tax=Candidatus Mycobacterium methanotrophicum TaxID=2943498 RepID=UPI001C58FF52